MCFCCCDCCCCDCFLVILAVIFPPLPVFLKRGLCSCDFLINICLCLLGWIPGMIHAWYIILSHPNNVIADDEERQIFIVTPPDSTHVVINRQPNQTRIKFNHPEPFLESSRNNTNNDFNQNNFLNSNNLSPLSNTPINNHKNQKNNYVSSPLSRPENFYGAIEEVDIESNDDQNQTEAPPSYENVMNETSKQFR